MVDSFTFHPPRRAGYVFHLLCIVALLAGSGIGLYNSAYLEVGPNFVFYLLMVLIAIPLIPLFLYRMNDLQNAAYFLERDSIRIQWGLRVEVIPTNAILWVRPASDLLEKLRLPWVWWPGAVLGTRRLAGGTPVEFLASQRRDLILVGTYERVFAVSPADPDGFLEAYQRMTELGSLIPPRPESIHPTFLLTRVWQTPPARYLLLSGLGLSILLAVWTGVVAPVLPTVSLGFVPTGEPRDPIPGIRLMLLPVLNTIFWTFDFFLGLFLFRRDDRRPLAFFLWAASLLVAALFLVALYFILQTG